MAGASMIIKITGSQIADSGNPRLYPTIQRFPSTDLAGLYLFEDGEINDAYPVAVDSGALGNDASLFLTDAPTRKSYGVRITAVDGLCFTTGIVWPKSGSIVMAIKSEIAQPAVQFPMLAGPSSNGFPPVKTDSWQNNGVPYPMIWLNSSGGFQNRFVLYETSPAILPSKPLGMAEVDAPADEWNVVAYTWAGPSGIIRLDSVAGGTTGPVTGGSLLNAWDAANAAGAKVRFGAWPFQAQRPCQPISLGAVAVYTRALQADDRQFAMEVMARRMIERGETVANFAG